MLRINTSGEIPPGYVALKFHKIEQLFSNSDYYLCEKNLTFGRNFWSRLTILYSQPITVIFIISNSPIPTPSEQKEGKTMEINGDRSIYDDDRIVSFHKHFSGRLARLLSRIPYSYSVESSAFRN